MLQIYAIYAFSKYVLNRQACGSKPGIQFLKMTSSFPWVKHTLGLCSALIGWFGPAWIHFWQGSISEQSSKVKESDSWSYCKQDSTPTLIWRSEVKWKFWFSKKWQDFEIRTGPCSVPQDSRHEFPEVKRPPPALRSNDGISLIQGCWNIDRSFEIYAERIDLKKLCGKMFTCLNFERKTNLLGQCCLQKASKKVWYFKTVQSHCLQDMLHLEWLIVLR